MPKNYQEDQHHQTLTEVPPGDYDNCTFSSCPLSNADLTGRVFTDCTFTDCDLTNAKLHETALKTVTFERSVGEEPRWLSTHGLGVYWLHVRIDQRPKYYHFDPYKGS